MYRQIMLHNDVKAELRCMIWMKNKMEKQLETLPKGAVHKRNGRYYHIFRENGKQKMRAIKEHAMLNELSMRRYIEDNLPKVKRVIARCNAYLENDILYDTEQNLLELPEQYRGVEFEGLWLPGDVNPEEWGSAEYEQNPMPIAKPSETAGGRLVRSKSEAFIGSEIENVPLFHRYEPKLVLFGEVFYPDFMFILPKTRRIVIWEHFGRMDDPDYVKKVMHKLEVHSKAGWILGVNFFFTFETEDMPFSFPGAKAKMEEILSYDKIDW